jgi:N-acetyl sugar amidotransferase
MKYCTYCLMPETRPRITFDAQGVCSACTWAREKQTSVDWKARRAQLEQLCEEHRASKGFDCILPVSGGKDSSYVAYMMKHKMGMHPLCVTIRPGLALPVGEQNVVNFIQSGYDHVHITPDPRVMRAIDKIGLVESGRPLLGWMTAVQTAIFRVAVQFGVPLIMFGEEGETEYGGTSKLRHQHYYDAHDSVQIYLSGHDPARYRSQFSEKELYWFTYPSPQELQDVDLCAAHWSYFENWDPYEHYLVAKEKCGLQEQTERSQGTYNNFAQTDTSLYNLHVYLMYLKFGFGRCTQDVGIDIRRGAMSRKQALALVRKLDREDPEIYIPQYLDYFGMTRDEFDDTLDRHVSKTLFRRNGRTWEPLFEPA